MSGAAFQITSAPKPEAAGFALTGERAALAEKLWARYPEDRRASAILPLLDLAQRENGGWLSKEALAYVAEQCDVAVIRVYEVASFYTMFYLEPVGKHVVQVCRTTPCWLRGSDALTQCAREKLKLELGESNEDFTLIEVECLGACANAPMVQINDDYYEDLTPAKFKKILATLAKGEAPQIGSQAGRGGSEPAGGPKVLADFDPSQNKGRGLAPFEKKDS